MDVYLFMLIVSVLIGTAVITVKNMQLVAFVAGIALIMMALSVQSSGLDIQTGFNETVSQYGNHTERIVNYQSVFTFFSGLTFLQQLLALVIGGIGILIVVYSVR